MNRRRALAAVPPRRPLSTGGVLRCLHDREVVDIVARARRVEIDAVEREEDRGARA